MHTKSHKFWFPFAPCSLLNSNQNKNSGFSKAFYFFFKAVAFPPTTPGQKDLICNHKISLSSPLRSFISPQTKVDPCYLMNRIPIQLQIQPNQMKIS